MERAAPRDVAGVGSAAGEDSAAGVGSAAEEHEVRLEAVAPGGHCVGRVDGRVVFVRHGLPGELVRVHIREERRRYLRADAVEVLQRSADRVDPPCRYARPAGCGGCDLQHVSLPAQRRWKSAVVREHLRRIAGIERAVRVEELPGAPDGLGWRTRVTFAVDPAGRLGLHPARSREVLVVEDCLLAHPGIRALDLPARRWPGVRSVRVAVGATGEVLVSPQPGASGRRRAGGRAGGRAGRARARVREAVGGRTFRVSEGVFWQAHPGAPEALVAAVLTGLAPRPGESAWDLYAGAGLFAAFLAGALGPAGRVLAVESAPAAVADARVNLADLPGTRVLRARVDEALAGGRAPARVDLVVLDPPRAGAGAGVVDGICARRPRRIAYVSCDPATLARDLAAAAASGYRLADLRAFDAFPMTEHVECVAILTPTEADVE